MKTLEKKKKVNYELTWEVEVDGKTVERTANVKDVQVRTNTGVEPDDILTWVSAGETKKLEGLCKLANDHQLFHSASSANKARALKFAKGEITRDELDAFVYSHDFAKEPSTGKSAMERALELLGKLTPEQKAAIVAAAQAGTEEEPE